MIILAIVKYITHKNLDTGIVVKTTGSWHTVKFGTRFISCKLKGSFRKKESRNTNPIAVGDEVSIELNNDNTGIINKIHPRKNYIIRRATKLSSETQILAANVDQVILMFTLDFPETPLEFVDRFLLAAEAYHISCILVINKIDLYSTEKLTWLNEVKKIYSFAGYITIECSITLKQNTDSVYQLMKNKINLIAGNSGVGKSSLINLMCPELTLKTSEISHYHQSGKHTTTYPEMFQVDINTFIIDSPGIRGFGITDIEKNELGLYFTDIFHLSKDCQFYNCSHIHEPHCAVIKAFREGVLHESRYRSYYKIYTETGLKYRIS